MKFRLLILAALCAAALVVPTAVLATSSPVYYYVALGDSVAAIDDGYPQQLLATVREETPTLKLVNLSCPGEATSSMISGYTTTPPPIPGTPHFGLPCQTYPHGSQLDEAVAFLSAHRSFVALVTIDIGAGDFADCLAALNFSNDCRTSHQSEMTSNLATILDELRAAAGPSVPIVGMNYYDAFAGLWVLGDVLFGGDDSLAQALALASVGFTGDVNDALKATYVGAHDPWADVETAFAVTDFTDTAELPGFGTVPLSVFNACTLTLFCSSLDVHPNAQGSAVIAQAFEQATP